MQLAAGRHPDAFHAVLLLHGYPWMLQSLVFCYIRGLCRPPATMLMALKICTHKAGADRYYKEQLCRPELDPALQAHL